jgi:hypothetical protein
MINAIQFKMPGDLRGEIRHLYCDPDLDRAVCQRRANSFLPFGFSLRLGDEKELYTA